MFPVTYQAASIRLENQFLPRDAAELHLGCEGITVAASAVTAHGIETRRIERMVWTADYPPFEQDGQRHPIRVARPAVKTPPRARFPRR